MRAVRIARPIGDETNNGLTIIPSGREAARGKFAAWW